jgi:hypothetical protein
MKFRRAAAERIATPAETIGCLAALDRPDRGNARAFAQRRFVSVQFVFELDGARLDCGDGGGVHFDERSARAALARALLLALSFVLHGRRAGNFRDATRSVFNRIDAIFQLFELLSLLLVLHAQARVFAFDVDMLRVAEHAVEAVERGAQDEAQECARRFEPAFMNADATNFRTRTRGTGDDKSV